MSDLAKRMAETKPIKTDEHRYYSGVRSEVDENGEARVSAPAATHYVRSYAQDQAHKEYQLREERRKGRKQEFTFTHMDNIHEVIDKVSDKHCGYLLYLQCFVNYDAVLENPDKTAMSRSDIMGVLDLKKTAFSEFINEMMLHQIIFADGDKYRMNPRYHFQGKTDNLRVIKSFTTKVKKLYSEVNAKDLGFVYKLLPFVHFETNTICSNPFEVNVGHTIPLNKSDLAVLTGLTEKAVYTKLRNLKFGDEYVFAEIVVGNQRFYKINPFVFYRKNSVPDVTLREIFLLKNSRFNR